MNLELVLREVELADFEQFFEFQQDPKAIHMAGFTVEDPANRHAFDSHW